LFGLPRQGMVKFQKTSGVFSSASGISASASMAFRLEVDAADHCVSAAQAGHGHAGLFPVAGLQCTAGDVGGVVEGDGATAQPITEPTDEFGPSTQMTTDAQDLADRIRSIRPIRCYMHRSQLPASFLNYPKTSGSRARGLPPRRMLHLPLSSIACYVRI